MQNYKIIFFCPSIEIGGVEKNLIKISNYFQKKKEDVHIITCSDIKIKKLFNKGISIKNLNSINKFLPYFIKVIICFYLYFLNFGLKKNNLFLSFQSNLYFILLAKITGNKIISRSNASPDTYLKNKIKRYIFSKIYGLSDKVIVNSNEFAKNFKRILKVKPIVVYNPSYNLKEIKLKSKKPINNYFFSKKNINFINVGRLTEQKNQILLLKTFKELNFINYKLLIIGTGKEYINLQNYIISNNLNNKVKILKNISNPLPYIKKSDVFILSSLYEGLPNVLIEAQALKKIIISSNCKTGPNEILISGKAGYLFKNNNKNDLKSNILSLIKKNKINKKKILEGYRKIYRFDENKNCLIYHQEVIKLK